MKSRQMKFSPKERLHLPLHVYLAYLLVCTFLLTGVSFSRYISKANADDSARVAKGVVTVTYDDATTAEMDRPTDDGVEKREFEFKVSNDTSEVAIRYDVVVTLNQPLGPGVTMTLDENTSIVTNEGKKYKFFNIGTFAAGVEETKTHTLSFNGDFMTIPSGTDDTYNIEISIRSQQIN